MKKLYLILLMLLILFIPATNAVAVYQLDQPIKKLDNYTLRQVFSNRNMVMPNLIGKEAIEPNVFRLHNTNGITLDYNLKNGTYTMNGTAIINSFIDLMLIQQYNNIDYTSTLNILSGSYIGSLWFKISTSRDSISYMENLIFNYDGITKKTVTRQLPNNIKPMILFNTSYIYNNLTFTIQLENGSIPTPYQVPTPGPYNQFDFGLLDLTSEQIQTYYNLYLEAVRFEQENIQASQDIGGYQNIFRSIINGVKNLISEMGYVWQWLNAPILTSDFRDYQFNIDWSWDLIGVIRQIINSAGVLVMQILFFVPSSMFILTGIPIQVSILSLLFSNLIFLLLGWIMVKSFLI